jgi:hypothetical protein
MAGTQANAVRARAAVDGFTVGSDSSDGMGAKACVRLNLYQPVFLETHRDISETQRANTGLSVANGEGKQLGGAVNRPIGHRFKGC